MLSSRAPASFKMRLRAFTERIRDLRFFEKTIDPDDGVYLPYLIRESLNIGEFLSKPALLSSLGCAGMTDVGLYLTLNFLKGNISQQIKLIEEWSTSVLDNSKSLEDQAKICAYYLAHSTRQDVAPQKAYHVYRYGPTQYHNLFRQKLSDLQSSEMPCFVAYSGLLGLRAHLFACNSKSSFMVYFPQAGEFEGQAGLLPLVHFDFDAKGQLRGRVLKWHELNELMQEKTNFRVIDDILRTGKTIENCANHLKELCNRESQITVLTEVSISTPDTFRYEKWLMKNRPK